MCTERLQNYRRCRPAIFFLIAFLFAGFAHAGAVENKIDVDVHIMSKCPYGAPMLKAIIPNVKNMRDIVTLKIHYIGRSTGGKLESMHGKEEVEGNKLQLCAHDQGDLDKWLDFISCQDEDLSYIPAGWEECAKRTGLDMDAMKKCYTGKLGSKLLKKSFDYSKKRRVTGSPTVYINGRSYKGPRTETALGRAMCEKMGTTPHPYCAKIPAPVKMDVTVVTDKTCTTKRCDTKKFIKYIDSRLEAATITKVDYSTPRGKLLFEQSGLTYLPLAYFPLAVEQEKEVFAKLRGIKKTPDGSGYVLPLGREGDSEPPKPESIPTPPAAAAAGTGQAGAGPAPAGPSPTTAVPAAAPAGQPATGVAPAAQVPAAQVPAPQANPDSSCGCNAVGETDQTEILDLFLRLVFAQ